MFSLATRRAFAPACSRFAYPAPPACFGDGDGRDHEETGKARRTPPAAGLFGERSRSESLPFASPTGWKPLDREKDRDLPPAS